MRQISDRLRINTRGQGLHELTSAISRFVAESGIEHGLLTIFCRHTSASLIIQENADPDVRYDLERFFHRLVREDMSLYRHTEEGSDDMPAHIRAALTQVQLSIPVESGKPVLGTWQGIYLFEHRHAPHQRELVLHLIGEQS